MLREIDRKPINTNKDALAGFKLVPNRSTFSGSRLDGFMISVSRSYFRLSGAASDFFKGLNTSYVLVLTNQKDGKIALVPASPATPASRKLIEESKTGKKQIIAMTGAVREALNGYSNINLASFRYHFNGELVDDGGAGVLIFDTEKPRDAKRVKPAK